MIGKAKGQGCNGKAHKNSNAAKAGDTMVMVLPETAQVIFNIIIYVLIAISLYFWVKSAEKDNNTYAAN
jgi:hypothetical protein